MATLHGGHGGASEPFPLWNGRLRAAGQAVDAATDVTKHRIPDSSGAVSSTIKPVQLDKMLLLHLPSRRRFGRKAPGTCLANCAGH